MAVSVGDIKKTVKNLTKGKATIEQQREAARRLIEMTEDQIKIVDLREVAARAAHEANRAYCRFIGDDNQLTWDDAPEWQRLSAMMGAENIRDNPTITPEQQHSLWMAHKKAQGWKFGELKDEKEKTHPCMVAYEDLPAQQKFKDALFGSVVRGVLGIYVA